MRWNAEYYAYIMYIKGQPLQARFNGWHQCIIAADYCMSSGVIVVSRVERAPNTDKFFPGMGLLPSGPGKVLSPEIKRAHTLQELEPHIAWSLMCRAVCASEVSFLLLSF